MRLVCYTWRHDGIVSVLDDRGFGEVIGWSSSSDRLVQKVCVFLKFTVVGEGAVDGVVCLKRLYVVMQILVGEDVVIDCSLVQDFIDKVHRIFLKVLFGEIRKVEEL